MDQYSFSREAVKDLNQICDYIAAENPKAASRLFDAIRKKAQLIANFPNMGKNYAKLKPNLKGFLVGDYIIFYYASINGISIVRGLSGRRDLEQYFSEDS